MNDGLPGNIRFTVCSVCNQTVFSIWGSTVFWIHDDGVLKSRVYLISHIRDFFDRGKWVLVKPTITPSMILKPFKI